MALVRVASDKNGRCHIVALVLTFACRDLLQFAQHPRHSHPGQRVPATGQLRGVRPGGLVSLQRPEVEGDRQEDPARPPGARPERAVPHGVSYHVTVRAVGARVRQGQHRPASQALDARKWLGGLTGPRDGLWIQQVADPRLHDRAVARESSRCITTGASTSGWSSRPPITSRRYPATASTSISNFPPRHRSTIAAGWS